VPAGGRACVRACVPAGVPACVRAGVRACVRTYNAPYIQMSVYSISYFCWITAQYPIWCIVCMEWGAHRILCALYVWNGVHIEYCVAIQQK